MQILVPIATRSSFFPEDQYFFPKPLIEVAGRPMIELVVSQLKEQIRDASFVFVIDRDAVRSFSIDKTVELIAGDGTQVIQRSGQTSGALCSCLLAIDALDPDAPLLIANSDQIIRDDLGAYLKHFEISGAEAGVITFDSVHPRWSYVVEGPRNRVLQTFEKKVVSRQAIAGIYYFRKASQFVDAAKKTILNNASINGNFFISSAVNQTILDGKLVVYSSIEREKYFSFYAPSQISEYERQNVISPVGKFSRCTNNINVIIPAAGEGRRFFVAGWKKPKPFIDVDGKPMLRRVIENVVPKGANATLVLQSTHADEYQSFLDDLKKDGSDIIVVDRLMRGTACTVLCARKVFDNDQPMMIANSDQIVDFDVEDFIRDCSRRGLDGSILVFRDPSMDPKWSFVELNSQGLVSKVAEKKAISDLATVGIYLFTKGSEFASAAIDMLASNDTINDEFYTCPVYNYMISKGARIGVYEIPMKAMSGLGTPEDLTSFLELRGAPPSADAPR